MKQRNDIDTRLMDHWLHEICKEKAMKKALDEIEKEWAALEGETSPKDSISQRM
jgi:hypothetical protein